MAVVTLEVGAVVSELVVVLSDVLLSDVLSPDVLSPDVLSSTVSSLDLLQLTAVPIIIKNNTYTILLCVIFLTDKDMITLNNPSTLNIINNLGIIDRS